MIFTKTISSGIDHETADLVKPTASRHFHKTIVHEASQIWSPRVRVRCGEYLESSPGFRGATFHQQRRTSSGEKGEGSSWSYWSFGIGSDIIITTETTEDSGLRVDGYYTVVDLAAGEALISCV